MAWLASQSEAELLKASERQRTSSEHFHLKMAFQATYLCVDITNLKQKQIVALTKYNQAAAWIYIHDDKSRS